MRMTTRQMRRMMQAHKICVIFNPHLNEWAAGSGAHVSYDPPSGSLLVDNASGGASTPERAVAQFCLDNNLVWERDGRRGSLS
jgi:hypothetical protein